jgi:predicted nucleic acid-binding Zn ribbon protein
VRRRPAPRAVGGAVGELAARLAPATLLGEVQRVWDAVAGPAVAASATPTAEHGGVLTVTCESSVWANELDLMGPQLVAAINAALGRDAVKSLRCRAAPARGWEETL